jgi:titin
MKTVIFLIMFLVLIPMTCLAQATNTYTFTLNWKDNATNETGQAIYRDGTQIGKVGPNVTSYKDQVTATVGNPVCYEVTSFIADASGKITSESVKSNRACMAMPAAVLPVPTPNPPAGLSISAISSSGLRITWEDLPNEVGYELEGKSSKGNQTFEQIASLAADVVTYDWTGRRRYTSYCVRLRGLLPTSASVPATGYSPTTCATTTK